MITKYYNVPLESMLKLAEVIETNDLNNSIIGLDPENEQLVTVVLEVEKEADLIDVIEMFNNGEIEEVEFEKD